MLLELPPRSGDQYHGDDDRAYKRSYQIGGVESARRTPQALSAFQPHLVGQGELGADQETCQGIQGQEPPLDGREDQGMRDVGKDRA